MNWISVLIKNFAFNCFLANFSYYLAHVRPELNGGQQVVSTILICKGGSKRLIKKRKSHTNRLLNKATYTGMEQFVSKCSIYSLFSFSLPSYDKFLEQTLSIAINISDCNRLKICHLNCISPLRYEAL